jgi:hypothetical protein
MRSLRFLPRFTVFRMIILVALAVVPLWIASIMERDRLARLSMQYERRADEYVRPRPPIYWRNVRGVTHWDRPTSPVGKPWESLTARERWAVEMANKYRQAAKEPRLPVAPDPPRPPPE